MLDVAQFREQVVRPVLQELELHSAAAENLLVGTAVQESRLTYLRQLGGGPALGVFQMEPATHDDIWENYLAHRPERADALRALFGPAAGDARHLTWNLGYAAAMCRLHYYRRPQALPDADDGEGLGRYWKQHYNTPLGAGTVAEFVSNYQKYVG